MTGYQQLIVLGNVGRDAEMKYLQNGQAVCNFSLAVSERWHNSAGEPQEKTTWFRVALWGQTAENLYQYLTKGKQVLVTGTIDVRAYAGNDGQPAASLELRARDVRLVGRKDEHAESDGETGAVTGDIPF